MLYTDKLITELWEGMRDIPFDEDEKGELYISKDYGPFDKGDSREDIWHWFDEHHSVGLYKLMGLDRGTL